MDRLVLVALGGAVGTLLRFLTATAAGRWLGLDFPYGTMLVNLAGAFLIGLVQELSAPAGLLPETTRLMLTTGLLGGLTTYSAFTYETVRLLQTGAWTAAALNVTVTTLMCLLLCVAGMACGRLVLATVRA